MMLKLRPTGLAAPEMDADRSGESEIGLLLSIRPFRDGEGKA
jgi:hypothetical protein